MIRSLLPKTPLYIQIWKDRLRVRNPRSLKAFDDKPIVGLDESKGKNVISAIGATAESTPCRKVYPFGHPRLIIHEFLVAERLMRYAFFSVTSGWFFRLSITAVVHVMEPPEDGPSDIEVRALREMCVVAGAREVHIWSGRVLTDAELLSGVFRGAA